MNEKPGAPDAIQIGAEQQNPHDGENSGPVVFSISQEDLATLRDLKDSIMRLSGILSDQMRQSDALVRKLNESLYRAERIQNFKPAPVDTAKRQGTLPTIHAVGLQKILKALHDSWPVPMTTTELASVCKYSLSTVRTYLPILKDFERVEYVLGNVLLTEFEFQNPSLKCTE